jgi:hypothetical protein
MKFVYLKENRFKKKEKKKRSIMNTGTNIGTGTA